jgi:hypothetical protein
MMFLGHRPFAEDLQQSFEARPYFRTELGTPGLSDFTPEMAASVRSRLGLPWDSIRHGMTPPQTARPLAMRHFAGNDAGDRHAAPPCRKSARAFGGRGNRAGRPSGQRRSAPPHPRYRHALEKCRFEHGISKRINNVLSCAAPRGRNPATWYLLSTATLSSSSAPINRSSDAVIVKKASSPGPRTRTKFSLIRFR